jgi:cytidine deaminase
MDGTGLMEQAELARQHAYAPYSKFRVGAALQTADGRVFLGCNVENASLGLSICAERAAVWKAVSEGVHDFVAIAVTAGRGRGAAPCGACRQVLHEFAPELRVLWRDRGGRVVETNLGKMLGHPFSSYRRRRT